MEWPVTEYSLQPQIDEWKKLRDEHIKRDHTEEVMRQMYRHRTACMACEAFNSEILHLYNVSTVKITMLMKRKEAERLFPGVTPVAPPPPAK